MIIQRNHIDDYIKCPYLYAINSTKSRPSTIKIKNMNIALKKYLIEIASYEMKNNTKIGYTEYRTRYTNKIIKKSNPLFDDMNAIKSLNKIFEVFANNAFVGYNVPIEIPVSGTSSFYRYIVDFILTNDEGDIIVVELEDLSEEKSYCNKLKYWPHYYSPFSFLAEQFDKSINLLVIDPENFTSVKGTFAKGAFTEDYNALYSTLKPIDSNMIYFNLYSCNMCDMHKECKTK